MIKDRRGVAAMEFALIGGLVIALLAVVFSFGVWIWVQMSLQSALAAGAAYAQVFPTQGPSIKSTSQASLPAGIKDDVTVTAALDCGASAGQSCPAGTPRFVILSATLNGTGSLPTIYQFFSPALPNNSVTYHVRIQ